MNNNIKSDTYSKQFYSMTINDANKQLKPLGYFLDAQTSKTQIIIQTNEAYPIFVGTINKSNYVGQSIGFSSFSIKAPISDSALTVINKFANAVTNDPTHIKDC